MTPDSEPLGGKRPGNRAPGRSLRRRIWVALAAAAAVAIVVLSWRVPEPEVPKRPRQVENMSFFTYTPQQAPPPNYGSR